MEEARPFLTSLGIVVAEGNEVDALLTEGGDLGASTAGAGVGARALLGRKVVTKLLVCLGDLERYREMYSERERERKGRLENGKSVVPEEKRFERAREVYSRARELMPENGEFEIELTSFRSSLLFFLVPLCFGVISFIWISLLTEGSALLPFSQEIPSTNSPSSRPTSTTLSLRPTSTSELSPSQTPSSPPEETYRVRSGDRWMPGRLLGEVRTWWLEVESSRRRG